MKEAGQKAIPSANLPEKDIDDMTKKTAITMTTDRRI
jgi:hypothetical protein